MHQEINQVSFASWSDRRQKSLQKCVKENLLGIDTFFAPRHSPNMTLLTSVKVAVFDHFVTTTHAPTVADIATRLNVSTDTVQKAFDALDKQQLIVLEPGDPSRIRMASPFSAIPTTFKVTIGAKMYFANCVWDSLGIPAALHQDGMVRAQDGHTREPMNLVIRDGSPKPTPCVIHFAVPAAHWRDDVIYT
jgi:Alkylmercury lyase